MKIETQKFFDIDLQYEKATRKRAIKQKLSRDFGQVKLSSKNWVREQTKRDIAIIPVYV